MCRHDGAHARGGPFPFRELGARLSNWGRWGESDRIGTLNHITPARRAAAAAEIQSGRVYNLGLAIGSDGIQTGAIGRINPVHLMSITPLDPMPGDEGLMVCDDYITMPLQSVTQWDGLAHVGYDGMFYNGVPAASVNTRAGSTELSIDAVAGAGVAGRGILLDIARLRGVERMAAGETITAADLDAAAAAQGTQVRPGDIVLVRTGWIRHFTIDGSAAVFWDGSPGLAPEAAEWLHAHDIAAVCADNYAVEAFAPGKVDATIPFHCIAIRDMGLTLGEIFVLDELAEACARSGRWSFFFVATPLLVKGGVGSPLTPLALL